MNSDDRAGRSTESAMGIPSNVPAVPPPPPPIATGTVPPPLPTVAPPSWAPPNTSIGATTMAPLEPPREPPVALGSRAVVAQIALVLNLVATIYVLYAVWEDRKYAAVLADGAAWSEAEFDRLEALSLNAGVTYGLTFLGCIVAFIVWFHRAYKNVASWQAVEHRTGWAIGAWFVPFLNFWRPAKIAEEIMFGSQSPPGKHAARWLWPWWSLFMLSNFIDRYVSRAEPDTFEAAVTYDTFAMVSAVAWLISGVLLLMIIRQVTRDQRNRRSS